MHGYDLIYYQIIDRDAGNDGKKGHVCTHPVEGPRIGVWCRIPAVDYTLAEGTPCGLCSANRMDTR
jgi:hypothetical protein